jgi:hypothetical protein
VLVPQAPSRERLQALHEVVALGYPRGVQQVLDRIAHEQPECVAWLASMRALAQAFQFDRMNESIRDALANESP